MGEQESLQAESAAQSELKKQLNNLVLEIVDNDPAQAQYLTIEIMNELLHRGYKKYDELNVDPTKILDNYWAFHFLIGSSPVRRVPRYLDLPGEESILSILTKRKNIKTNS